jgi:putative ABC transport system permease protein
MLDSWNPERPYDDDRPKNPPNQLTYRDAMALMESQVPTYKTAMFKTELTVFPPRREERPFRARTRVCFRDFFALFDTPFQYGGAWSKEADVGPQPMVVLDHDTNQKLFGGNNSVGKQVRIEDRQFTVAGVLAPWRPKPTYFDPHNGAFEEPEEIFVPFRFTPTMRFQSSGNTNGWKSWGSNFEDFLQSEAVWIQYWVQLDDAKQKETYLSWLNGYVGEQKKQGRFARPLNNRVVDVPEWLEWMDVVPPEAKTMLTISLLFLVVSSVNLIGILLGKFLARSPEVGVRRALGASRRHIFLQHVLECELVGLMGGVVGVLASLPLIHAIDRLMVSADSPRLFQLELPTLGVGILLALAAGLVAGIYPAWRICRIPPAAHLKAQ